MKDRRVRDGEKSEGKHSRKSERYFVDISNREETETDTLSRKLFGGSGFRHEICLLRQSHAISGTNQRSSSRVSATLR